MIKRIRLLCNKMDNLEKLREWRKSPIAFVKDIWGLTVEKDNNKFIRGRHLTWQQYDILLAVEKALNGLGPRKISISSGHGIGKSSACAMLMEWFLFCFKDAQVAATAPSSDQLYDVLWKEASKWLDLMPEVVKNHFYWSTTHIRMVAKPNTWFARAKTGKKESPEALAGMHGENVLLLCDEASGIPDEIFNTAEGSLTDKNTLVILISNPTRLIGYFYDTHHRDNKRWQCLQFSSLDSPLVAAKEYGDQMAAKHGIDSDEYGIRVLGKFPNEDSVDNEGYVPLFSRDDVIQCADTGKFISPKMGLDPSGEGINKTLWVIRDAFRAKVVGEESISTAKGIALKTLTLMDYYGIKESEVIVDNFGTGAAVVQELALSGSGKGVRVIGVNVGEKPNDFDRFMNRRMELYWELRMWLKNGGELVRHEKWEENLLSIRYRRELSGKARVMDKREMRRKGYPSPDLLDALMLTFYSGESSLMGQGGLSSGLTDEEMYQLVNIY